MSLFGSISTSLGAKLAFHRLSRVIMGLNTDKTPQPFDSDPITAEQILSEIYDLVRLQKDTHTNKDSFSSTDQSTATRQRCNCTQTKCLKLYCICFARGDTCSDCGCLGCANNEFSQERQVKLARSKAKQPAATKGCACTKSQCLRMYCDCRKQGLECGPTCQCLDCGNHV